MHQVIANLLSNAIKFTSKGHIRMSLRWSYITQQQQQQQQQPPSISPTTPTTSTATSATAPTTTTNIRDNNNNNNNTIPPPLVNIHFEIEDTGIGIEEQQLSNIFHKFSQADFATTRKYGGTGLGLSIVESLLELMGGKINVTSKVGVGSVFFFDLSLPLAPEDVAISASSPSSTTMPSPSSSPFSPNNNNNNSSSSSSKIPHITPIVSSTTAAMLYRDSYIDSIISSISFNNNNNNADIISPLTLALAPSSSSGIIQCDDDYHGNIPRSTTTTTNNTQTTAVQQRQQQQQQEQQQQQAVRILVAEDNQVNQKVVTRMLQNMGYTRVDIASNGLRAVERVRSTIENREQPYDIIFMDICMPEMDGNTATEVIRHQLRQNMPIIALTAGALESDRVRCAQHGMNDFLSKPLAQRQLALVLDKFLSV